MEWNGVYDPSEYPDSLNELRVLTEEEFIHKALEIYTYLVSSHLDETEFKTLVTYNMGIHCYDQAVNKALDAHKHESTEEFYDAVIREGMSRWIYLREFMEREHMLSLPKNDFIIMLYTYMTDTQDMSESDMGIAMNVIAAILRYIELEERQIKGLLEREAADRDVVPIDIDDGDIDPNDPELLKKFFTTLSNLTVYHANPSKYSEEDEKKAASYIIHVYEALRDATVKL